MISVGLHSPTRVNAAALGGSGPDADTLSIYSGPLECVTVFLPFGTAQSVADAFNAAIKQGESK